MADFVEFLDPGMPTPMSFNITGGYDSDDEGSQDGSTGEVRLTPVNRDAYIKQITPQKTDFSQKLNHDDNHGFGDIAGSPKSYYPIFQKEVSYKAPTKSQYLGLYDNIINEKPDDFFHSVHSFPRLQHQQHRSKPQARNVFERLTDHRFFTGIHRERFDENGYGRGLAGREYVYIHDGKTESASRVHEVYSTVLTKPYRKTLTRGTLGIQKFGVQIATPKLMWLYRNGDKHHEGVAFYIRPFIKNMDVLFYEMGKELQLIAGPIRKIYDQNLQPVREIEDIVDGAKYLCTSGEPPAPAHRLGKFMSEWVIQKLGH